jgi:Protein of unknown function (DUF4231)
MSDFNRCAQGRDRYRWGGDEMPQGHQIPENLKKKFPECSQLVEEFVIREYANYRRRARQYRFWFRSSGILVVILSVSLPLVANVQIAPTDFIQGLIISVISLSIAAITTLRTFFNWEQTWSMLRNGESALDYLLARWKLEVARFAHDDDDARARERAIDRTRQLLKEAREINRSELETYFSGLSFPQA